MAKTNMFLNFVFRFPRQLKKTRKWNTLLGIFCFTIFCLQSKLNNKRNEIYFIVFSIFPFLVKNVKLEN